jgi:cellulose synthase/poly-beta-1,6-N-acetylglucosamine synthase-like glycosyltransferase
LVPARRRAIGRWPNDGKTILTFLVHPSNSPVFKTNRTFFRKPDSPYGVPGFDDVGLAGCRRANVMSYAPFISVIIPTFNRARQVQAALISVLTQTYQNFEVIVVDDGSTDGTREAVEQVIDQQHSRVRYLFQTNQGQSAARNKGIDAALGQWLGFLDSDDVWLPEKLEWQVRAVDKFKDECGACISDARLVDDLGLDKTAFRSSGKRCDATLGV